VKVETPVPTPDGGCSTVTRGVDLTAAGELFLERARLALAAADVAGATGRGRRWRARIIRDHEQIAQRNGRTDRGKAKAF
jgi:hypothetical protein